MQSKPTLTREGPLHCIICTDNKDIILCKDCGCQICSGIENIDTQIMCDKYSNARITTKIQRLVYWPSYKKNDENEFVRAGEQ